MYNLIQIMRLIISHDDFVLFVAIVVVVIVVAATVVAFVIWED